MIKLIDYKENPITHCGKIAGLCWGANTEDDEKNFNRGLECIQNNHGRVMEYADITVEISEYSARVIRELYTHIIGTSRLQESTRYVDCSDLGYYIPPSIKVNPTAKEMYEDCIANIMETYSKLLDLGVKKEDVANLLPLGSHTKVVLKINLRALINLFHLRLCTRAYIEFRHLMIELKKQLRPLSKEWELLCDEMFVPKCINMGYCDEKYSCGLKPKKEHIEIVSTNIK